MITRALDAQRDWTFGNGLQNYLRGEAAVEQNVVTTVLSWVGDCYYALFFGVDWHNRLDVGQQQNLVQEVKQVVAGCYGVVGVLQIDGQFNGTTRAETITAQVATIFTPQTELLLPVPPQGT